MDGTDGISVGVIGPPDLVAALCALGHPMLRLIPAPYEDEGEAAERFRSVATMAEVALFTGPMPYHLVCAQEDVTLPLVQVPLRGNALYPAFYRARTSRLSVDTLSMRDVQGICTELGLDAQQISLLEGMAPRRDLVTFHEEQYRSGGSAAAVTCLRSAYQELTRRGVPAYWVTPSRLDMVDALEQARRVGESARNQSNQAVVLLISLDVDGEDTAPDEIQRRSLAVQAGLLRFAAECEGYAAALSDREWHLFTTRGSFDQATESLACSRRLEELRFATGYSASVGIGFGLTADTAGIHAREALGQAQRRGRGLCFAMMADKRVVGPLGEPEPLAQSQGLPGTALAVLADTAVGGTKSVRRLVSHLTRFPTFTAHEIAPVLGLSLRSAHRILARMEESGVIEVVGQERLPTPGRPRQVYKLTERSLALSVG